MTRYARQNRVFFWEEPLFDADAPSFEIQQPSPRLHVVTPHLPPGSTEQEICQIQRWLLNELVARHAIDDYVLWYYTPLALQFSRELQPSVVVYDCMDELSAFRGAPPGLRAAEQELFSRADLVFTGGHSLYESKKRRHPSVHCFPSSIEREFFETARRIHAEPDDQASLPHPRLGYCGVIDERMDMALIAAVADARPEWQIVMLGPVVKISEAELPHRANIHYFGKKDYARLPSYLAGWDVGLLPFALNQSTRYISPTKTPEYLAAGLSVVSTPIRDVVRPYGTEGLVEIASTPPEFVRSVEKAIAYRHSKPRLVAVDRFLSQTSWDLTADSMYRLLEEAACSRRTSVSQDSPALGTMAAD